MHKYQYATDDGVTTLIKDGKGTACPFPPPYVQATALNPTKPELQRFICTTSCPLAELSHDPDESTRYTINCGCQPMAFVVTDIAKDKKDEQKSNLVIT